jgi:hypothetical protein
MDFSIADVSDDEIKMNKTGRAYSAYGARRGAYRVLVGETWRKETTWKTKASMGGY